MDKFNLVNNILDLVCLQPADEMPAVFRIVFVNKFLHSVFAEHKLGRKSRKLFHHFFWLSFGCRNKRYWAVTTHYVVTHFLQIIIQYHIILINPLNYG